MHKWGVSITLATLAFAVPAAAAENALRVTDPCGDNKAGYRYDGEGTDLPDATGNRSGFDAKALTVTQTASGIRATFEMCGAITSSNGLGGWRVADTSVSEDCILTLGAVEGYVPQREARFVKTCFNGPEKSPLAPFASDTSDTRFDITLSADALSVSGSTMTVDVARAGLTGEAAAALASGTVWKGLQVRTIEGYSLMGFGGSSDDEGNTHGWSWSAPFAYDWGYTNVPLTLN